VIHGKDKEGPREWMLSMGYGPARLDEKGVRPVQDFTDRVIRDKRYKIHVLDGKVAKLYDLQEDPGEESNLIASKAPEHAAALAKLAAVVETFPKKDARPRYDPLPAQPWDITRDANAKMLN
jgi:arylsulfatase A-like enzyme